MVGPSCPVLVRFVEVHRIISAEPYRFDDFKVFRVKIEAKEQLEALKSLKTGPNSYEYFDEPQQIGQEVDVLVPPFLQSDFDAMIRKSNIKNKLMIQNMQDLIDKERLDKPYSEQEDEEFGWTDYYDTQTIHEWLYSIEELYDEVTIIKAGTTYEGRDILGVNINRRPGQNPGIFIESQIHAREWITSASATWIINQLLTATDAQPEIKNLADNIN
uniref:Zinc carboxypeptidase A 1 n=1 Tax=Phlebotomus papatasi TaxID=29031 RepID=A0A1B0DE44_PHLPP